MAQTFDLKKIFLEGYGWSKDFKFEIVFSKSGVARIYINNRKTQYTAGGYGYDKVSTVISNMINDLLGVQDYNINIYGNRNGLLSHGVGFESTKESFESIAGNELKQIYSGKESNVYEIKFSQDIITKLKG